MKRLVLFVILIAASIAVAADKQPKPKYMKPNEAAHLLWLINQVAATNAGWWMDSSWAIICELKDCEKDGRRPRIITDGKPLAEQYAARAEKSRGASKAANVAARKFLKSICSKRLHSSECTAKLEDGGKVLITAIPPPPTSGRNPDGSPVYTVPTKH